MIPCVHFEPNIEIRCKILQSVQEKKIQFIELNKLIKKKLKMKLPLSLIKMLSIKSKNVRNTTKEQ